MISTPTKNSILSDNSDMFICRKMDNSFENSYSKLGNTITSIIRCENNYQNYRYNYRTIINLITYHGEQFQLTNKIIVNYKIDDEYWYASNDEYQIFACGSTIKEARRDFDSILYETFLQYESDDDSNLSTNALTLKRKFLALFEK